MSERYVPTTQEVREMYVRADRGVRSREEYDAEFQRWLAERDAEVAAKALEEAASAMREYGWGNPARMIYARAAEYRKEGLGL